MILTAINEREQWGHRVTRTIPRRWWLRGPLFLFYSGSGGGVLFLVLLLTLTIALPSLALMHWNEFFVSPLGRLTLEANYRNTLTLVLLALYTFDYCLTAVWLRAVLLPGRIKAAHTWALAPILWGLGFCAAVAAAVFAQQRGVAHGAGQSVVANQQSLFDDLYLCVGTGRGCGQLP